VIETASNVVDEGERAGRTLLDVPADRRPTAVVAQSDILAAGVVQAAVALGLRVPDDVSVTGFDGADLPWLAGTLTTVVQPSEAKGRAAAEAAMALVAGGRPDGMILPVSLRVGTTSGPPPAT
jgi:DNA-binding LacI/PurR family transcriptional regulator